MINPSKILIIQTAFIGDVVLATPIIEALRNQYAMAKIDFLLRKGNESLLKGHPKINHVWIWNKKEQKILHQIKLISALRKQSYDLIINVQRFMSSGLFTALGGGKVTVGFKKNPLSRFFTFAIDHRFAENTHETDRNLSLLNPLGISQKAKMKLYPTQGDYAKVKDLSKRKYIVIAPTSVWFTKQFPAEQWVGLLNELPDEYDVFCIGGPGDKESIDKIIEQSEHHHCTNLCGELSLLESTALIEGAHMSYVNDSAPMHLASSVNAPTTAIFCSTLPQFGFGPQSDHSYIVETQSTLSCRPCGLHGRKTCPEGHFKCATTISTKQLLFAI